MVEVCWIIASSSSRFFLQSEFASRRDLIRLGDRPNLNSSKRARNLASIRVSKASNLASNKPTDVMTWLISIGRWQPSDLSPKAAAMVEEEEGSSDVGCGCAATSWLRVAWLQQGCDCNRRKTRQRCARLLRRRIAAIRSERPLLVMFNSLLATIKIVGNKILLRLRWMRAAVEGIREVGFEMSRFFSCCWVSGMKQLGGLVAERDRWLKAKGCGRLLFDAIATAVWDGYRF
ncbi:hypothetical protein B296_00002874 [Ensete ventricosum]|uniref:Uncharacterized protein n=1 Tax=Ensete ventricosum TaxID=4639 RepID=A0A426Z007_ENSVE|nr:hypothetical protein B296_00002874 [Ensete ventricosum]